MSNNIPSEPPPAYNDVVLPKAHSSNAATSSSNAGASSSSGNNLDVPGRIPMQHRRSMEDEQRSLPKGWVRTFDPESSHQFYVDTTTEPPRSIWTHPYDDGEYLKSLTSEERERIEHDSMGRGHPPSRADIMAEHTDEEDFEEHHLSSSAANAELPPRPDSKGKGKLGFGEKMKNKLTGTTREQRAEERKRRAEEEQRVYERHMMIRQAMSRAAQTGKPQLIGKDKAGKDIYIEPPSYGGGGFPGSGYPGGGYGYDPYRSGIYSTPNARYVRPSQPYGRQGGYGYGGGYGMPLALGGGLMVSCECISVVPFRSLTNMTAGWYDDGLHARRRWVWWRYGWWWFRWW